MAGKNTAAFGIFANRTLVENAVDRLRSAGYRNTDISVLFPDNVGTKDFAHKKGTKAPEGATAGAGTGVVLGGTLGWLVGIGSLAIPGLGPFIAAGPIMAALAGGRHAGRRPPPAHLLPIDQPVMRKDVVAGRVLHHPVLPEGRAGGDHQMDGFDYEHRHFRRRAPVMGRL